MKNDVRKEIMRQAEELGVTYNKYWSTDKITIDVAQELGRLASLKENAESGGKFSGRSEVMRRAWVTRKFLYGPGGFKPVSV